MSSQAVRFDADADKYRLPTAGFGGVDQSFTVCLWVYLSVSRGYYQIPWSCDNGGASYVQFGVNYDGVWLRAFGNGSAGIDGPNPMLIATWTFIAISHDAVTDIDTMYWAHQGDATLSSHAGDLPDASATSTVYLGGDGRATDEWVNGRIAAVKMWHAVVDVAELEAERLSYKPSRLENLFAYYTFWNGPQTADESGNGHTLTAGTSPTAEAGPPGLPLDAPPGYKPGRIWDDRNGLDTTNIGADGHSEFEWNLQMAPSTIGGDFQFRVYAGATPLDAYTTTPQLSLGGNSLNNADALYAGALPVTKVYAGSVQIVP